MVDVKSILSLFRVKIACHYKPLQAILTNNINLCLEKRSDIIVSELYVQYIRRNLDIETPF